MTVALATAACGATEESLTPGITIMAPADQATVSRNYLTSDNQWVAPLRFQAKVDAPGAVTLEWVRAGRSEGLSSAPDWTFDARIAADGPQTYEAIARDDDGEELARAQVTVVVLAPSAQNGTCQSKLTALGQAYTAGPATAGIEDPVTIMMPLNGIPSTAVGSSTPRATWKMDCRLALALWRAADAMKQAGIVAMTDYGIYNYRCIDQSVDPPCPGSSLSQHALGMAVDIYSVKTKDNTTYTVLTDWIIDTIPAGSTTCATTWKAGDKNFFLHSLLCGWVSDHVWNIFLTPNYNADHRNHFHVDLTPRSDVFARKLGVPLADDPLAPSDW